MKYYILCFCPRFKKKLSGGGADANTPPCIKSAPYFKKFNAKLAPNLMQIFHKYHQKSAYSIIIWMEIVLLIGSVKLLILVYTNTYIIYYNPFFVYVEREDNKNILKFFLKYVVKFCFEFIRKPFNIKGYWYTNMNTSQCTICRTFLVNR